MAQDRSYPEVYMAQGTTSLVIGSSGVLDVYGKIAMESGGYIADTVASVLYGTAVPNTGVTVLAATSGPSVYTLTSPTAAGQTKKIVFAGTNSTNIAYVYASTAATFETTGTYYRCPDNGGFLQLVALGTTQWVPIAKSTGVTISTGSTA